MTTGLPYGITNSSKTRVRCIFCGVHIPKANKCIEQHTNGSRHKEAIEIMAENGLSCIGETLYCKPCNLVLGDEDSVLEHIETDDHANWMAAVEDLIDGEYINLDKYLTSDKDDHEVACDVCKSTFKCTLPNLESHVNGYNHRANLAEKVKPLNGIFPVAENDELWCKICNVYIENSVQSLLDHIDEEFHLEWFEDIEAAIDGKDISIEEYLKNEHNLKAHCNICNTDITCSTVDIEDHILSQHFSEA